MLEKYNEDELWIKEIRWYWRLHKISV
jgi:hypothetical protein